MTTLNTPKRGKSNTARKPSSRCPPRRRVPVLSASERLRKEYGLSLPTLARVLRVNRETLARSERAGKMAKGLAAKVDKVAALLRGLSRVMPKASLAG
jgi:hypothetical protein